MKLAEIKPYARNAKRHNEVQIQQIANSIKEFGFNQPIVVDKNGVIIVGHGRYEASKVLGLDDVPVIVADLTEKQAKSYRLADNKLNESGTDLSIVIEELKGLDDELINLTGFDKRLIISDFEPNLNPEQGYTGVTSSDIEKKDHELIKKFQQNQVLQNVTCPHCGEDFQIS